MAKREYRSPTGKLLGYSQNETDRTGKGMSSIVITVLAFCALGVWQYFHQEKPSPAPAQPTAVSRTVDPIQIAPKTAQTAPGTITEAARPDTPTNVPNPQDQAADSPIPALPACNSDRVRLMAVQGYVSHYKVTIDELPQDMVKALATLTPDSSPAMMQIRRPIVDRGLARNIGDTLTCRSSNPDVSQMGTVLFITPSGALEGIWFGTSEPFGIRE